MTSLTSPDPGALGAEDAGGSLPPLLLAVTFSSGLVDAVSYLGLGHVFVANMTGNLIFLGFEVGGAHHSTPHLLVIAFIAFVLGTFVGGRLGAEEGRLLARGLRCEVALVSAALACVIAATARGDPSMDAVLVALLALAMGIRNAVVRRLGVADLTTATTMTTTLTGLVADASARREDRRRAMRRIASIGTFFVGGALGAALAVRFGIAAPLTLTWGVIVVTAIAAHRIGR